VASGDGSRGIRAARAALSTASLDVDALDALAQQRAQAQAKLVAAVQGVVSDVILSSVGASGGCLSRGVGSRPEALLIPCVA